MPRKSRRKSVESPATEPTPVAAVLEQSPIAQILASRDARAEIEPDQPMPEPSNADVIAAFQRQREREQAVEGRPEPVHPRSHVERLAGQTTGMQPVPADFRNVSSYPVAGMRVNRSLDRSVAAIQFAEDRKASRNGLNSEIDTMEIRGFRYEPLRRQWEREDPEQPGANIVDAAQLGAELAKARTGRTVG